VDLAALGGGKGPKASAGFLRADARASNSTLLLLAIR
jgi:hypothetical protein